MRRIVTARPARRVIAIERQGDVERWRMSSRTSRMVGYEVSAYLVRGLLVDTGPPSARDELRHLLAERSAAHAAVAGAIVTHWHEDHAGNVPLLSDLALPTWLAPATREKLLAHSAIGIYRRLTWGTPRRLRHPPPELPARAMLRAGLELLALPGHSADHHVVWDTERETLFGGDLFLGVKVRVAHPAERPRLLVESLRAAAALRPRVLCDAHRGFVERPADALLAKAEWLAETIGAIDRLIDAGWSDGAIQRRVLGAEDLTGWLSRGEYSRRNLVRMVRATR